MGCEGMKIYISGAISNRPREEYMRQFEEAEKLICSWGEIPINPARYNSHLPQCMDYKDFMHICFALLDCCDAILMLDGYEKSQGAMAELQYAKCIGKKIIYE